MGFLNPLALWALPLAALPWILAWHGRRTGEPVAFSSLYLMERARESARRTPTRSRWVTWLRCAVIGLLVLAAARPVGPGAGSPALHRPTRAVVAVDVSGSAAQRLEGEPAWERIAAAADSVLAAAAPDDRVSLATIADGLVGWWEGSPAGLRARLAGLGPTARASDWPAALAALAGREEPGSETYLVTDGSSGARGPGGQSYDIEPSGVEPPRRAVRIVGPAPGPNRALVGARRTPDGRVALSARAWGPGAPEVAEAGRRVGSRWEARAAIPLDGGEAAATWAAPDTATFALSGADPLPEDDVRFVATGAAGGGYRIGRWTPADEPPDPGPLFWEAALDALGRGAAVERQGSLAALAAAAPELALLPIRRYGAGEAALLAEMAAGGTRLLFAPACPDPACAPPPGWIGLAGPPVPDLEPRLPDPDRRTTLAPRPARAAGEGSATADADAPATRGDAPWPGGSAPALPEPLLDRAPIRGSWVPVGGPKPEWRWDLASGAPAAWARGSALVWLVPLGPPVTRLAETPLFPLVADRVLGAWDPRWSAAGGSVRAGEPIPVGDGGATVVGPIGSGDPSTWRVPPGGAPPVAERAGLYRIEPAGVRDGGPAANFVAVNGEPAEGNLTPVPDAEWSAWGRVATTDEAWRAALFPRRRGPDLWPWILALALAGLAAEATLRRDRTDRRPGPAARPTPTDR